MSQGTAFHSELMRTRDENIQKAHQRELAEKDNQLNRWRQGYDELSKTLYDERNGSERLARILGFDTVGQALLYVNSEGTKNPTKYRECLKRNTILENELEKVKEKLKEDCEEIASRNKVLQQELETQSHHVNYVKAEKRLLEARYDDLERTYKQVTARYAKDIENFEKWKKWLWDEVEADDKLDENGRAKKWAMIFMHRRKKLAQKGPRAFDDDVPGFVDSGVMKTPKPSTKPYNPPSTALHTPTAPASSPLTSTTKANYESSPTVIVPSPYVDVQLTPVKDIHSFDAENTSQDKQVSSDSATEDESFPDPVLVPPSASKPSFSPSAQSRYLKRTQHITTNTDGRVETTTDDESRYTDLDERLWNFEPPLKRRRMTGISQPLERSDAPSDADKGEVAEDPFNAKKMEDREKRRSISVDRENRAPVETAAIVRSSSTSPIQMPPPSTTTTSVAKHPGDYSAYKGHGRYAPVAVSSNEDRRLSELFVVNADRNQGFDYEFDDVVRGKERKRLMAGDCEECREYYEAIGPMPPRLQQPLWGSPLLSPVEDIKRSLCHHKGKVKVEASYSVPEAMPETPTPHRRMIDSHRQEISRHRVNWERGKTPPGYWDIGFPDTQEAQVINEKAKELHRQKFKAVQREALNENGRYQRR